MSYIQPVQIKFIHSGSHEILMKLTRIDTIPRIGETININDHSKNKMLEYIVKNVSYTYMIDRYDTKWLATINIYI
jgi:hypothetical protein